MAPRQQHGDQVLKPSYSSILLVVGQDGKEKKHDARLERKPRLSGDRSYDSQAKGRKPLRKFLIAIKRDAGAADKAAIQLVKVQPHQLLVSDA